MDIGDALSKSFTFLRKHPGVLWPVFIFGLIATVATVMLLQSGPVADVISTYHSHHAAFLEQNPIDESVSGFERSMLESEQQSSFQQYLEDEGFFDYIFTLLTPSIILSSIVFILVLILASIFANTAMYIAAKDAMHGIDLHWPSILGETTRRFIPSFFLGFFSVLLVLLPIALIIAFIALAFWVHFVLGILVAIAGVVGIIAWLFYSLVKVTMSGAIFFLEGKGVFASIKASWTFAEGRYWHIFAILIVVIAITVVGEMIFSSPQSEVLGRYLLAPTTGWLIGFFVTGVIAAIGQSIVSAYATTFLYISYLSDKKK